MDISAEEIQYDEKNGTYIARGSAKITTEDATLKADEISFNRNTHDAEARGNVYYEDSETIIQAEEIELNLKTRLGTISGGHILYKKSNYHIRGDYLKKVDKNSYFLKRAIVTTCDATPPPWHISGRDIKAVKHKYLKARNVTFYIRNMPFFYTPYFWMPLTEKRQTGLLVPSIGSSTKKGFFYKQGFFWAMRDNMDATFYLDYFSEKGIGKGLEYRYVITSENRGSLWLYHLRDNDLKRDFLEVRTYHDLKLSPDISGYIRINTVNTFDYYNILGSTSLRNSHLPNIINLSAPESFVFNIERAERLKKYLESNIYLTRSLKGGRLYLLGQYRQSLEGNSGDIPQSVPELGIAFYTRSWGNTSMNISMRASNFMRQEGQEGQRIHINPNLYLSYGRTFNLTQQVGIRGTAYLLEPSESKAKAFLDLSSKLSTRILRRYSSFLHAMEPSLEYRYTSVLHEDEVPVYDSIESLNRMSIIAYSITNRFEGFGYRRLSSRFRLSQSYDLFEDESPFTPLLLEGGLSSHRVDININTSYDFYEGRTENAFLNIRIKGIAGYIGLGKDFRRETDIDQYTFEGKINAPAIISDKAIPLTISGKMWYDAISGSVQESMVTTIFRKQCWTLRATLIKRPDEYQVSFGIEFKGLGGIRW